MVVVAKVEVEAEVEDEDGVEVAMRTTKVLVYYLS